MEENWNRLFRPLISGDTLRYWYTAVERFSEMRLTRESDKLPAISGIASAVGELLSSPYLAGLWHSEFPRCLLWYVDIDTQSLYEDVVDELFVCRSRPYRAPT